MYKAIKTILFLFIGLSCFGQIPFSMPTDKGDVDCVLMTKENFDLREKIFRDLQVRVENLEENNNGNNGNNGNGKDKPEKIIGLSGITIEIWSTDGSKKTEKLVARFENVSSDFMREFYDKLKLEKRFFTVENSKDK